MKERSAGAGGTRRCGERGWRGNRGSAFAGLSEARLRLQSRPWTLALLHSLPGGNGNVSPGREKDSTFPAGCGGRILGSFITRKQQRTFLSLCKGRRLNRGFYRE